MVRVGGTPDQDLSCVRCDRFSQKAVEYISRSFFLGGTMVLQLLWTVFAILVKEKAHLFGGLFLLGSF